jgi:TfoX/Sxy family transcriptional regulator of competence genes
MASKQSNVDFVLEQLAGAADVSARKMFGEYAIYSRGKVVALFCDDQLFVKPTPAGAAFIGQVESAPPYPGAKPHFLVTGDRCEDGDWLSELIRLTERALPAAKPKPAKTKGAAKPKRPAAKPAAGKQTPTKRANPSGARARSTSSAKQRARP